MNCTSEIRKGKSRRAGYTLVELIVGMFVFVVAVGLAVGAFIQALRAQRATTHLMGMNSNAGLMIEQVSRELRTGFNFKYPAGGAVVCSDYGQSDRILFTNSSRGNDVQYRFDAAKKTLLRRECAGSNCSGKSFEALSAADMRVERACFSLTNQSKVPRIGLYFRIGSVNQNLKGNVVNVQTQVSARIIPTLDL